MSEERRCGTCRHWRPITRLERWGECYAPVPQCVQDRADMRDDEGKSCQAWEKKQ